jgi:hypothetical protein
MATQLKVTFVSGMSPASVLIPIPPALQQLDSGQQASQQTGVSSVDLLVRSIFKAGVFYDSVSTWYSTAVVQSITSQ